MFLQQIEGRTSDIQNVQKSPGKNLRAEVGSEPSALLASSVRGIDIFNNRVSLHGNEQHPFIPSKMRCQSNNPQIINSTWKSFNLIFKLWESFEVYVETPTLAHIHTVAASSCRWSNVAFNRLNPICSASKQFQISGFVPQFSQLQHSKFNVPSNLL